ncbi:copper resistance protein CopC [Dactylosporangium sp. NPDC048998]|uniref:copper resistance CopC/CopD family protein n=1 Tax=Dactylosporangium sp. NPDC048998 TaxID=3363976 RepID=UPI00370FB519
MPRNELVRRVAALTGLVVALGVALLVPATPASAHAELLSITPGNGARLAAAPTEVRLRFSEKVFLPPGGIRVLGTGGKTVTTEPAHTEPDRPQEVVQPMPAGLGTGTYTVDWRVVSADSHPVHGGFVFMVGTGDLAGLPQTGAQADGVTALSVGYAAMRWLGYGALALCGGGAFVLLLCWPTGWSRPRVRRLLLAGWAAGVLSAVAVLFLQGAYTAGASIGDVFDPELLASTFDTDYGPWVLARLALLLAGGAGQLMAVRTGGGRRWAITAAVALGIGLPATWIGTGHANADLTVLTAAVSVGHLAAVSAWLGGLIFMVCCLADRATPLPADEFATAIARFSHVATAAVALLVVTGVVRAWTGVGTLAALVGSTYGELLTFKVALTGVMLWLGSLSRAVVRRRYAVAAGADEPALQRVSRTEREREQFDRRQLRWSMGGEIAIGTVVLVLATVLVATPPGAHNHTVPDSVVVELALRDAGQAQVTLDPPQVGPTSLWVVIRDGQGRPWDVPEVTATMNLPERSLGPLTVSLVRSGAGSFASRDLQLPMTGTWRLALKVRTTDIDQQTVNTDVAVF